MLLSELVLHNFGPYCGRHVIDLLPPSPSRPIVLFGGLNGAGKTSMLDALQLGLYGRRARGASRAGQNYDDYLRKCIHRSVAAREGAAVEVAFYAPVEGVETLFRVNRSWENGPRGIKEQVTVWRGDHTDRLLATRWDDFVEELLPLEIAGLFFFDGEKIEALADPERTAVVVGTAIESLLGLDLVDRLNTDLVAVERRHRTSAADAQTRSEIDALQEVVQRVRADLTAAIQEQASLQNDVDRRKKDVRRVEDRFRKEGGELFERRAVIEAERTQLLARIEHMKEVLVDQASGVLPLGLAPDLLKRVAEQDRRERRLTRDSLLTEALEDRDREILSALEGRLSAKGFAALEGVLTEDRQSRSAGSDEPLRLRLSEETSRRLGSVTDALLPEAQRSVRKRLRELDELRVELDTADRALAAIPSRDALDQILAERQEARQRLDEASARLSVSAERSLEAERRVQVAEADIDRALKAASAALIAREEADRIVRHAARVRDTLAAFRQALLERHLSRIEAAVLDSYRKLTRKQHLVTDLQLDPDTFELRLLNDDHEVVAPERLSAGERQLLAVALLWGLGRIAGKRLPTVIDTPLGRLDSTHRRLLVERYFPAASEQVILLSTDEEIDEQLLELLAPAIGRSYEIRNDDATGATTVAPGYFWETTTDVA